MSTFLEVSRNGGVTAEATFTYNFTLNTQKHLWAAQRQLRTELKAAASKPRLKLANNGEFVYRNIVLTLNERKNYYDPVTGQMANP